MTCLTSQASIETNGFIHEPGRVRSVMSGPVVSLNVSLPARGIGVNIPGFCTSILWLLDVASLASMPSHCLMRDSGLLQPGNAVRDWSRMSLSMARGAK